MVGCHSHSARCRHPNLSKRVAAFPWSRHIRRVDLHHTHPAHADYRGLESIERMARTHVEVRGFEDIAQHVTVAPDASAIWTGRDWNRTPASCCAA